MDSWALSTQRNWFIGLCWNKRWDFRLEHTPKCLSKGGSQFLFCYVKTTHHHPPPQASYDYLWYPLTLEPSDFRQRTFSSIRSEVSGWSDRLKLVGNPTYRTSILFDCSLRQYIGHGQRGIWHGWRVISAANLNKKHLDQGWHGEERLHVDILHVKTCHVSFHFGP